MWIPNRRKICPRGLRDIVGTYLQKEEIEDFAFWAFGDNYLDFENLIDYIKKWNELHGGIYFIDMSNTISEDLKTMCDLWEEYGKQN